MRKRSTTGRINFNKFQNEISQYEGKGLNLDEIMEVKEAFDFIDNNDSGIISKQEFVKAKKMLDTGLKENERSETDGIFDEMLTIMDKDKSGNVCFDEFISVFNNVKDDKMSRNKYYQDLFYLFAGEVDDSKKLALKDMKNIVNQIEEDIEEDELKEMFERADEDKDGFVGEEEFVKFMMAA